MKLGHYVMVCLNMNNSIPGPYYVTAMRKITDVLPSSTPMTNCVVIKKTECIRSKQRV